MTEKDLCWLADGSRAKVVQKLDKGYLVKRYVPHLNRWLPVEGTFFEECIFKQDPLSHFQTKKDNLLKDILRLQEERARTKAEMFGVSSQKSSVNSCIEFLHSDWEEFGFFEKDRVLFSVVNRKDFTSLQTVVTGKLCYQTIQIGYISRRIDEYGIFEQFKYDIAKEVFQVRLRDIWHNRLKSKSEIAFKEAIMDISPQHKFVKENLILPPILKDFHLVNSEWLPRGEKDFQNLYYYSSVHDLNKRLKNLKLNVIKLESESVRKQKELESQKKQADKVADQIAKLQKTWIV